MLLYDKTRQVHGQALNLHFSEIYRKKIEGISFIYFQVTNPALFVWARKMNDTYFFFGCPIAFIREECVKRGGGGICNLFAEINKSMKSHHVCGRKNTRLASLTNPLNPSWMLNPQPGDMSDLCYFYLLCLQKTFQVNKNTSSQSLTKYQTMKVMVFRTFKGYWLKLLSVEDI